MTEGTFGKKHVEVLAIDLDSDGNETNDKKDVNNNNNNDIKKAGKAEMSDDEMQDKKTELNNKKENIKLNKTKNDKKKRKEKDSEKLDPKNPKLDKTQINHLKTQAIETIVRLFVLLPGAKRSSIYKQTDCMFYDETFRRDLIELFANNIINFELPHSTQQNNDKEGGEEEESDPEKNIKDFFNKEKIAKFENSLKKPKPTMVAAANPANTPANESNKDSKNNDNKKDNMTVDDIVKQNNDETSFV